MTHSEEALPQSNTPNTESSNNHENDAALGQTEDHKEASSNHTDETQTEIHHEISLSAEPIFNIGSFNVTNSLLNSWLVVIILVVFSLLIKSKIRKIPKGLQNVSEFLMEGALNLCDSVTNNRKLSKRVFPWVFAFFIFILLNNWLGIFPGIGSIGFIESGHGHSVFVPYFRGATADLNTTLALALIAVIGSNIFGMMVAGVWKYTNKFVNIEGLMEIPRKVGKDPSVLAVNPIKFFVGLIEIIGEIAKVASLSFRLFGNVFAGEVLLSSIAVILAYGLPIPFMFLEVLVGFIQALIFAMLTLVYFTIAAQTEDH